MRRTQKTIAEMLRKAPIGKIVVIKRAYYVPVEYRPISKTANVEICGDCAFKGEKPGAEECPYSSACMAHRRADNVSVVFIKIDRK